MARTKKSTLGYVEFGYGQVEPNHLSAQRNGKVYAQLPAASTIDILENGQFVKYDYASGVCNFDGPGEWMLVFNEVKVYRDFESDADFALIKDDYVARTYSPVKNEIKTFQTRYFGGTDASGNTIEKVTRRNDPYEIDYNENPFQDKFFTDEPELMPEGTTMVPRVFKTDVGDIFTTNTIDEETLAKGDVLVVRDADGVLVKAGENPTGMQWKVVKVYTMPDMQKGVKLQRIA